MVGINCVRKTSNNEKQRRTKRKIKKRKNSNKGQKVLVAPPPSAYLQAYRQFLKAFVIWHIHRLGFAK